MRINTNPPNVQEITQGIKELNSNKSAGTDGIAVDILKADAESAGKILHTLMVKIWKNIHCLRNGERDSPKYQKGRPLTVW